jgi:HK97 gp10 family phage protein
MKLQGMEGVKGLMKGLPEQVQKKIARETLKKAGATMAQEVKNRVPVDSGALKNSIKTRISLKGKFQTVSIEAGGKDAWYARLVEYGFNHTSHGKKKQDRKVTSAGFIQGRAFLRNSAAAKFEDVIASFEKDLVLAIDTAMKAQMPKGPAI